MLEDILLFTIIFMIGDIEKKLSRISAAQKESKAKIFPLENYLHKRVSLTLNSYDVKDIKKITSAVGEILDFDEEWFSFKYDNKFTKQTYIQYLRIKDIASIEQRN